MTSEQQDGGKRALPAWAVPAMAAFTLALSAALLVLRVLRKFDIAWLFDDAYIFQRYAHNLLNSHRVAWNPGGPHVYGVTSLLFLAVNAPLQAIAGNQVVAALLSSVLCGVAFVGLVVLLLRRQDGSDAGVGLTVLAVFMAFVSRSSTVEHFVTGMDTMLGLAFAAGYFLVATNLERVQSARLARILGIMGALTFWVRPELTAYALLVPAALALLSVDPDARRLGRTALLVTVGGLGVATALTWLYFGWPLPLPFHAKSLGLYGESYARVWEGQTTRDLLAFAEYYWLPLAIIGIDLVVNRARLREAISPVNVGVLVGTLAIGAYIWLRVLPIMGFSERFFQPLAPAIALLFAGAAMRGIGALSKLSEQQRRYGLLAALGLICCLLIPSLASEAHALQEARRTASIARFDLADFSRTQHSKYWFKLDRISKLPDDLVIATTEVGALGAMNLNKTIVDMSGLNDPLFSRQAFNVDWFFALYQPDLIYMPHPDYRTINEQLTSAPPFANYLVFSKEQLHTRDFGIAIKKTSRHYQALLGIVGDSFLEDAADLLRQGNAPAALTLAQQVTALQPSSRSYFTIGLAWAAQSDLPHAVEAYRQSVVLDPKNADAYNNLGFSLASLGRRNEAILALQQAVRLAPENQLARNNLAWATSLPSETSAPR